MRADLTRKASRAASAVLCALLPTAVSATDLARDALPPEGCALMLTVQAQSCLTTRVWTCPGDPAGQFWYGVQIDGVDVEVNRVDAGFNRLETHYIEQGAIVMQSATADPVKLSALLATGSDAFDFVRSGDDGRPDERYFGELTMMGRIVTIDDQPMHQVFVDYEVFRDGALIWAGDSVQYLSPDETMLFYGQDYDAEGTQLTDFTPLRLLTAGQDVPARDCEG